METHGHSCSEGTRQIKEESQVSWLVTVRLRKPSGFWYHVFKNLKALLLFVTALGAALSARNEQNVGSPLMFQIKCLNGLKCFILMAEIVEAFRMFTVISALVNRVQLNLEKKKFPSKIMLMARLSSSTSFSPFL